MLQSSLTCQPLHHRPLSCILCRPILWARVLPELFRMSFAHVISSRAGSMSGRDEGLGESVRTWGSLAIGQTKLQAEARDADEDHDED